MDEVTGMVIRGVAAAPGVAVGPAVVLNDSATDEGDADAATAARSATREVVAEQERWRAARQRVMQAYAELAVRAREVLGAEEVGIFEAQSAMADDPELEASVCAAIADGTAAEHATREAIATYASALAGLDDEYMRQRADDVREIGRGILRALAGLDPLPLTELPEGCVLCARELAAGSLILLDRSRVSALVVGSGGPTSHLAILARTLGIPAVLGIGDQMRAVTNDMQIGVDGTRGIVYVQPTSQDLAGLAQARHLHQQEQAEIAALAGTQAVTSDGVPVALFANIGNVGDIQPAQMAGAEGIGLFRTEFLVTGRSVLPTEEEQFDIYRTALTAYSGHTVIFRTFDIGGDKPVPALGLPSEANPFLGYRALRIGLDRKELLTTQLRAILRAAQECQNAWIMLPMVATVEELRAARALYEEARRGLSVAVPLGIMIEIPAAALNAHALAREADFFSIGTNDLVQYTLAVDRLDERLTYLYQPFHPAVLKLIQLAADAAAQVGKVCGVCGELAGDPQATALLLGLGVTELSMNPASLGYVKREVRRTSLVAARTLAREALACATAAEVVAAISAFRAQPAQP